jgi:hypothetical protein
MYLSCHALGIVCDSFDVKSDPSLDELDSFVFLHRVIVLRVVLVVGGGIGTLFALLDVLHENQEGGREEREVPRWH